MLPWPRWSTKPFARQTRLLLWPAGTLMGIAAEWRLYGWQDPRGWVPDLLTGWCLIACGLAGWARRPQSRSGALLAATGFAWFVPDFGASSGGLAAWLGAHALYLHRGPLVQLILTYPLGRVRGRQESLAVAVGYAAAVVAPAWHSRPAAMALVCFLVAVATRDYVRSAGRERRMRRSALQATVLFAAAVGATAFVRFAVSGTVADGSTLLVYQAMLCVLAAGVIIGLLRWPWDRVEVADLVVELGETRSGTLRGELARALGDPSLQVGYWLPESAGFVDASGEPLALPGPGSERAATVVERDGQPLAVLVHDPAVLADQGLVEAVSAAARLAASNARLQADVRARLAEIAASRRRILAAGDEERDRLERRLRDGAQRLLADVAGSIGLASESATGHVTGERIDRAQQRLNRTQEDLSRFARGLHPRHLTEDGLGAALAALAGDFPLRVDLTTDAIQTSPSVAACVYFVCAEALANAAKHASASAVNISVTVGDYTVTVEVVDDGSGGADPQGRGIRGLADRVETLGGSLTVVSPLGRGTSLMAVIPDNDVGPP